MSRVTIEYFKSGLMVVLAIITAILIVVGHNSATYIAFPVVFSLLAVYFWWKADLFSKENE